MTKIRKKSIFIPMLILVLITFLNLYYNNNNNSFDFKLNQLSISDIESMGCLVNISDNTVQRINYQPYDETSIKIQGNFCDFPIFTEDDAIKSIMYIGDILKIKDIKHEIKLDKVKKNGINNIFYFSQYYQGIEMYQSGITIISNIQTGEIDYLYSSFKPNFSIDVNPIIEETQLKDIINNNYKATINDTPKLIIYDVYAPTLAWDIPISSQNINGIILNANSGEVLYEDTIDIYE